jgi:hypothetical protein
MKTRLLVTTATWVAMYVTGAIVSIAQELPFDHPLWGTGDANEVARDWLVGSGTALVAPVTVFIIAGVATILLLKSRPLYTVGVLLLAGIGLLNTIGSLGEALTWEAVASDTFNVAWAVPAWGSFLAGMFMWAFAVADLAGRQRGTSAEQPVDRSRTLVGNVS